MTWPSVVALSPVRSTEQLLTPAEVAARLAVSRSMAYKLVRTGELTPVYIGRLPRIAEADLEAYIVRQRQTSKP
jgi:excisionase family DNA binding protein